MELITILLIVFVALFFFKIMALFLDVAIFAIALPFKILGVLIASFVTFLLLIPLGIVAAISALFITPFFILLNLTPFILIAAGLYLMLRKDA